MGVQEYRFVRRYLERHPQAPLSLQQVDPLIRELVVRQNLKRSVSGFLVGYDCRGAASQAKSCGVA